MINNKKVLAVVPARGGSKGIKLKNLRKVAGLSLIEHVAKCISEVEEIDRAVLSTDNNEIKLEGERVGLNAPFRRPRELSGDLVGDIDVLKHALNAIESIDGMPYDIVLMLQPTSPLRRPEHVSGALNLLVQSNFDAVWSISEIDSKYHPLKQICYSDGKIEYWDQRGQAIIARQQLSKSYIRNGVVYAISKQCIVNQKTILGSNTGGYFIKGRFVSIDTEEDIEIAEKLLGSRQFEKNDKAIST